MIDANRDFNATVEIGLYDSESNRLKVYSFTQTFYAGENLMTYTDTISTDYSGMYVIVPRVIVDLAGHSPVTIVSGAEYFDVRAVYNTRVGTNVKVEFVEEDVNVTFANVTEDGQTSLNVSATGPTPPSGFNLSGSYYNIITTTAYTGNITVCINYNDSQVSNESSLRLFHYENGTWVDVTVPTSPDIDANIICGTVTSLSEFIVAEATTPPITPPVSQPTGGGGGGGTTKGVIINKIEANSSGTAIFDIQDTGYVSEITIYSKETVFNVRLVAEAIEQKPFPSMPETADLVLSYLKLSKFGISNAQLEKADVKFQVPVSWLKDNDIAQDSVLLKRNALNAWEDIETLYLNKDSDFAYFSAVTPGFSYFVITGDEGSGFTEESQEEISAPQIATPASTTPPPATPAITTPPPTTPAPSPAGPSNAIKIFLAVALIAATAAYYQFVMKKR